MPIDTIKRAIEKATGGGEGEQFEEIVYEGYGPGGVALLVEAATDNRNRTAAEVRSIFTKAGGQLAVSGRGRLAVRAARADHGIARCVSTLLRSSTRRASLRLFACTKPRSVPEDPHFQSDSAEIRQWFRNEVSE